MILFLFVIAALLLVSDFFLRKLSNYQYYGCVAALLNFNIFWYLGLEKDSDKRICEAACLLGVWPMVFLFSRMRHF